LHKKTKIFISFIFILTFCIFFQTSSAKYVIEYVQVVAKLDIDRCKPNIELTDIVSSNSGYPTYANKTHLITGHIKITEKNIVRNELSTDNIKVTVANNFITPEFQSFTLISESATEKIYEFSFTNTTSDGSLVIVIPEGIVEDKSGLINEEKYLFTGIYIDNTPPTATFTETSSSNNNSIAQINTNELIRPVSGWNISSNYMELSKEFNNTISYALPIMDWAQNSSEVLVDISNATNISIKYGTYDTYSLQTIVSNGAISAPQTISSNSISKSEVILIRTSDNISLQGRAYVYTYWGEGARGICKYSELPYYHGYNPSSTEWLDIGTNNALWFNNEIYSQFGGRGLNVANATCANIRKPIPSSLATKYLYGISGIQFKLKDSSNYLVVYQSYVSDIGWLEASSDGEENLYLHSKPISAFRINIVPKSEKQYLIDFWNRDVGTSNVN
jgi:hypothetical protein